MTKWIWMIVVWSVGVAARGEFRVWEDRQGRTVEAELMTSSDAAVVLRTRSGRQATLSLGDLSDKDRAYLASLRTASLEMLIKAEEHGEKALAEVTISARIRALEPVLDAGAYRVVLVVVGRGLLSRDEYVVLERLEKTVSLSSEVPEQLVTTRAISVPKVVPSGYIGDAHADYEGCLVVVYDEAGRLVLCKADASRLEKHREALLAMNVGARFDKHFTAIERLNPMPEVALKDRPFGFAADPDVWQILDKKYARRTLKKTEAPVVAQLYGETMSRFAHTRVLSGDFGMKARLRGGSSVGLFLPGGEIGMIFCSLEDADLHELEITRKGSSLKFKVDGRSVPYRAVAAAEGQEQADLLFGVRLLQNGQSEILSLDFE